MHIPRRFYAPLTAMFAFAIAAPAQAAVTATQIGAPAKTRFVLYDTSAAHPKTLAVAGTATGSGDVDIVCMRGTRSCRCSRAWTSRPTGRSRRQTFRSPRPPTRPTPKPGPQLSSARRAGRDHAGGPTTRFPGAAAWHQQVLAAAGLGQRQRRAPRGLLPVRRGHRLRHRGRRSALRAVDRDPGSADAEPQADGLTCFGTPRNAYDRQDFAIDGEPAYPPAALDGGVAGSGLQGGANFPELPEPTVQFDEDTGDASVTRPARWRGARPTTCSHRARGPARASIARRSR